MAVFSKLLALPRAAVRYGVIGRRLSAATHGDGHAEHIIITSTQQSDLPRSLGNIPEGNASWYPHLAFIACLPFLAFAYYNAFYLHEKGERQEFVPYATSRMRKKPYPWGDGIHSLFHHPYWNALPMGYETDDDGNPLPKGIYYQGYYTVEEGYPDPRKEE